MWQDLHKNNKKNVSSRPCSTPRSKSHGPNECGQPLKYQKKNAVTRVYTAGGGPTPPSYVTPVGSSS